MARCASYGYLCYVSTAIIKSLLFHCGIDGRRQNRSSKIDLRAEGLRQTDKQIFYWPKERQSRLICHGNNREICTCIYNIGNLLKSYDNINSMTYITKIMLTGIAIRNTGYYDNINDCYLKKIERYCRDNMGSIILFPAPKQEIKYQMFVHMLDMNIYQTIDKICRRVCHQYSYITNNLNSTRPPLPWSPSHIEKGDTMTILWKPHTGTAGFESWTHAWPARL